MEMLVFWNRFSFVWNSFQCTILLCSEKVYIFSFLKHFVFKDLCSLFSLAECLQVWHGGNILIPGTLESEVCYLYQ